MSHDDVLGPSAISRICVVIVALVLALVHPSKTWKIAFHFLIDQFVSGGISHITGPYIHAAKLIGTIRSAIPSALLLKLVDCIPYRDALLANHRITII